MVGMLRPPLHDPCIPDIYDMACADDPGIDSISEKIFQLSEKILVGMVLLEQFEQVATLWEAAAAAWRKAEPILWKAMAAGGFGGLTLENAKFIMSQAPMLLSAADYKSREAAAAKALSGGKSQAHRRVQAEIPTGASRENPFGSRASS